jgi:hypothetical protein
MGFEHQSQGLDKQPTNYLWQVDAQFSDWIFISRLFHLLEAWFFMVSLKRDVYKSKFLIESGSKTYEPNVPSFLGV